MTALPPADADGEDDGAAHEHRLHRCAACGTCRWCAPCSCRRRDEDDHLDADLRAAEAHDGGGHDRHHLSCPYCEQEAEDSAGYTRCPRCAPALPEGRTSLLRHGPSCRPLPTVGADHLPWHDLAGRELRLARGLGDGARLVVTGTVTAARGTDPLRPVVEIVRTGPGAEGGRAAVLPREWDSVEVTGR